MTCPFYAGGRQIGCLSLMRTREEQKNEDCLSCPKREERLKAAQPPQRINIPSVDPRVSPFNAPRPSAPPPPPAEPAPPVPIPAHTNEKTDLTEKKEAVVSQKMTPKERVYALVERRGDAKASQVMAIAKVSTEELAATSRELAEEGKIKVWTKGKRSIYAMPDVPCPFPPDPPAENVHGDSHTPAALPVSPPQTREKKRKYTRKASPPKVETPILARVSRAEAAEDSLIASTIAELERNRDRLTKRLDSINRSIVSLRELQ